MMVPLLVHAWYLDDGALAGPEKRAANAIIKKLDGMDTQDW